MIFNIQLILTLFLFQQNDAIVSEIVWLKKDAVVWSVDQKIKGKAHGMKEGNLWLFHNSRSQPVEVENGEFEVHVKLKEIHNTFVVAYNEKGMGMASDTLFLTLAYKPVPVYKPVIRMGKDHIHIQAIELENPLSETIDMEWLSATGNPETLEIIGTEDLGVIFKKPEKDGDYWIDLKSHSLHDTKTYKAMFRKTGKEYTVFGPDNPRHPWMDSVILYQLSPYNFSASGGLNAITEKLPDIEALGINTLYLQPIFQSHRKGQGYDIVNYFKLNPAYGDEAELRNLIQKANELGLRVLFDLVLNHSSIHHPYAKSRIAHGPLSHYNDFYHTTFDGAKYSSHYNADEYGFINYFWKDLVNLNYDNEEVQRWMLEACKYWVEEFGIDGYRFDAIWGVMARKPEFGFRLRNELKSIKPDIFMLAEAKGREPEVYEYGFDAAYDWTNDTLWVSQWSWEYEYNASESKTAFNHPDTGKRAAILKASLFSDLDHANRILRFTENNDLPRFPVHHDLERSKTAAALVFSIPGIPMLYQGQEIGALPHPYRSVPIFDQGSSIRSQDSVGVFAYYQQLISKRKEYPAFQGGTLVPLDLKGYPEIVAFQRTADDQKVTVILNPSDRIVSVLSDELPGFPKEDPGKRNWYNLLKDERMKLFEDNGKEKIVLKPYEIIWIGLDPDRY